jgi:hypothetical protein
VKGKGWRDKGTTGHDKDKDKERRGNGKKGNGMKENGQQGMEMKEGE